MEIGETIKKCAESIQLYADILSSLTIIVTIPWSMIKYWDTVKKEQEMKRKEQEEREYHTYDVIDQKYIDFQNFCFQYPRLDIGPTPNSPAVSLTDVEQKQEMLAFSVLLCLFERAYIMYAGQSTALKKNQWDAWGLYIGGYCKRLNFQQAWKAYGYSYDKQFQSYMRKLIP